MTDFPRLLFAALLFGLPSTAQVPDNVQPAGHPVNDLPDQSLKGGHKDEPVPKRDFVKKFRVEVMRNLDSQYGIGNINTGVSGDLACPICSGRFPSARVRPAVPGFGAKVTWGFANQRIEVFTKAGGINAWRPDNVVIDAHRSTSFNDVWLLQAVSGARIALDRKKHLWLGAEAGFFQTTGADQRKWSAATVTLTYEFGK